jgi:hypothetical protein
MLLFFHKPASRSSAIDHPSLLSSHPKRGHRQISRWDLLCAERRTSWTTGRRRRTSAGSPKFWEQKRSILGQICAVCEPLQARNLAKLGTIDKEKHPKCTSDCVVEINLSISPSGRPKHPCRTKKLNIWAFSQIFGKGEEGRRSAARRAITFFKEGLQTPLNHCMLQGVVRWRHICKCIPLTVWNLRTVGWSLKKKLVRRSWRAVNKLRGLEFNVKL